MSLWLNDDILVESRRYYGCLISPNLQIYFPQIDRMKDYIPYNIGGFKCTLPPTLLIVYIVDEVWRLFNLLSLYLYILYS